MNFDLTDSQKRTKKDLAEWLKQELQSPVPPRTKDLAPPKDQTRSFLEKLERLNFYIPMGIDPKDCQGSPYAEALTWVLLGEELAQASPTLFLGIEQSSRLFGWLIARYGNKKQIQEILVPLHQGQIIGALAQRESSGNFPGKEVLTEGQKREAFYKVTGKKHQVVNAPIADWLAITGKTDGQWAVFLIKSGQQGLKIGQPLETLGFKGLTMAEVTLDQCLVPEDQIIGPFPQSALLDELRTRLNLITTTASLGIMIRAFRGAKKVAGESQEDLKPAMAYQEIRFKLAEMFSLLQTSQWLVYRAAWMLEAQAPEAETVAAAAKVFITEAAETVAREAMQITGQEGYLTGNEIEACYRDARFGPVAGETSECLRMRIAEDCLGKYR